MIQRRFLLITIAFLCISFDAGSQSSNFHIFLLPDLLNHRSCDAIVISSEDGRSLWHMIPGSDAFTEPEGVSISVDRDEEISVTVVTDNVKFFSAKTYIGIPDSSEIGLGLMSFGDADRRSVAILINGAKSIDNLELPYLMKPRYKLESGVLKMSPIMPYGVLPYFIVKGNRESGYRYFLATEESDEYKLEFNDLPYDLSEYIIQMPFYSQWHGTIAGFNAENNHWTFLYNSINLDHSDDLRIPIPAEIEFDKYYLNIKCSGLTNYEVREFMNEIPVAMEMYSIELSKVDCRDYRFRFSVSNDPCDLFEVSYFFMDDDDDSKEKKITSTWDFRGLCRELVEYTLPVIPKEILYAFPALETATNPYAVDINISNTGADKIADYWNRPSFIFDLDWLNTHYHRIMGEYIPLK